MDRSRLAAPMCASRTPDSSSYRNRKVPSHTEQNALGRATVVAPWGEVATAWVAEVATAWAEAGRAWAEVVMAWVEAEMAWAEVVMALPVLVHPAAHMEPCRKSQPMRHSIGRK